jgi:glycosyltransferase involved in cell wall biosynthesis
MMALKDISNPLEVEVLLLHNEPTDEEIRIIRKYVGDIKALVNHVIIPEREGLYRTWNRGIELAQGEFLAVWNVDDIRTTQSLKLQAKALADSKSVLCYGNYIGVQNYGSHDGIEYSFPEYTPKTFLRSCLLTPFPMWRKDLHETIGYFDEGFRSAGDYDFQLRAARAGSFVKVNENVGYYLEAPETGISKTGSINNIERTVCELRYGIFDKVDAIYIRSACRYSLNSLKWGNESHDLKYYFSEFRGYLIKKMLFAPLMLLRVPINTARFVKHRVLPSLRSKVKSVRFNVGKHAL